MVGEADDGQSRETGRTDRDEHCRTGRRGRQTVHDHAPDVAGVHAHRDQHAQALRRQAAEEHGHRVHARLRRDAGARDRPAQHEREHGQIPGGRHVLDLQARVREEDQIRAHGDQERGAEVHPEEDAVGDDQPVSACGDGVVRDGRDDAGEREEAGSEE